MNILLVKPWAKTPTYFPPLGLAYIAAVLEKADCSVAILDLSLDNAAPAKLRTYIQTLRPDLVGITCMITEFKNTVETAAICKDLNPHIPVVVGGPLATAIPGNFLATPNIDVIVIGEGEETIVDLVKHIENGEEYTQIEGIAYKKNGNCIVNKKRPPILELDSLPFPSRHLLPMEKYFSSFETWFGKGTNVKATNIISSRGCPYSCIFCDKNVFGQKWRGRSAKNMAEEIEMLSKEHGINGLIFSDDMFDLYPERVNQFCEEIDRRNLNVLWGANSRVNHAKREIYKKMKRSGCQFIAFGTESGNQKVLDFMQKKITLEQTVNAVDMAKDAGLRTVGYFMIGMLGENRDTIRDTVQFARGLNLDSGGFSTVVPLPTTKLYELAEEKNFIKYNGFAESDTFAGSISLIPDITPHELEKIAEAAYWQFFWSRPSRKLPQIIRSLIMRLYPFIWLLLKIDPYLYIRLNRTREALRLPLP